MPVKPKDLKTYYSIQEVAQQLNISETMLRYWEREFPQLKPHRAGRGIRQYSKDDIRIAEVIYDLVKRRGMKIAAARERLAKNKEAVFSTTQALETLRDIRQQLVTIRRNISGVIPGAEYEIREGEND